MHPTFYGYLFLMIGLGLILLIALILRWLPRFTSTNTSITRRNISETTETEHEGAILVIEPGGRIASISQSARNLFVTHGKKPNLENLSRCTYPARFFLGICAREGQATFSLNGRLVEGFSVPAPAVLEKRTQPGFLVSLNQPSLQTSQRVQFLQPPQPGQNHRKTIRSQPSSYTLKTLAEISRDIAGNLDLDQTLRTILDKCKILVPSDFLELTIWENAAQQPQTFCLPQKSDKGLLVKPSTYCFSIGRGYAAWLVAKREPLLLEYLQDPAEIRPDLDPARFPYRSYLGYPILENRNLVGVLEFASLEDCVYDQEDVNTLDFFSGHIAKALQNAFLFRREHRKALELSGLADLTQAINAIREPQDLFYRLVESISPLVDVQVLGFMIFDETHRLLEAQIPFKGISSDSVVKWYQFGLQPGSRAEEIWLMADTLMTTDAAEDEHFKAFGLDHFARMTGIHQSVLVPLTTSGQMLGYLLVGNKLDGEDFDEDDVSFLKIISGKAAPIIENSNLIQLSRQRAQRAEVLRRIASLAKSNATLDETLKFSLIDLARLLQADAATVFLINTQERELQLHHGSSFGIPSQVLPIFKKISTQDVAFHETTSFSQKLFLTGSLEKLDPIPSLYTPFSQELLHHSLLSIPIIINQQGIGELVLGSQHANHFSQQDVRTAITACELMVTGFDLVHGSKNGSPSSATVPASIPEKSPVSAPGMETQIRQSIALQLEQQKTKALLRIFTELSNSLDLKHVLHATLEILSEYSGAPNISIWVTKNGKEELETLAMLCRPQSLTQVEFLEQKNWDQEFALDVIKQARPVLIEDILQELAWQKQTEAWQTGPLYRSILGAPLVNGAETVGCLLLLHPDRSYFSFEQVDLVQAVAYQVSMAINHAELFRLIHDQAEDFGVLLRNQQVETSRTKAILEAVADGVLVTDDSQKITLFNHSAERILGLQSTKVVGNSLEHFLGLFGGSALQWTQTIEQWTTNPGSYQAGETFSQQIHLDDDRIISVRLAPVFLNRGFLGTVSIFQDVTHQVELDRLKSEFVATVSHELRTPMTSIKGYVDILLMGAAGPVSEQQERFLEIIKSNADRLSILVNDLLDISRIEIGRKLLALQSLNLEELIDQTLEHYQQLAEGEQKSIYFTKNLPEYLPRVVGDHKRVGQILSNLVDNAYRYNIENGTITISAQQSNGTIQITIQDTGVGIPEYEISKVFDRFFRGETPLLLGVAGTGLGLSIVKNLVEMHHGQIWIESSGISGEGSKVSFTLPEYSPQK